MGPGAGLWEGGAMPLTNAIDASKGPGQTCRLSHSKTHAHSTLSEAMGQMSSFGSSKVSAAQLSSHPTL